MRIGIDGSCWGNRRGFGRFTRCLVPEMARRHPSHEYVLLTATTGDGTEDASVDGVETVPVALAAAPSTAAGAGSSRSIGDLLRCTSAATRLRCDVFFFPASYSYFPVLRSPVVVTVHDAIAEQLPHLTLATRGDRLRWRLKQAAALRQARVVITVSEASRRAITTELAVDPGRVRVIREAPASCFRSVGPERRADLLARFGLAPGDRYVVYVGGISPHKNLLVLLDAFCQVASDHADVRLLLVGDAEDDPFLSSASSVRRAAAASPVAERITLTGYVSDDELAALYSGALATCLPSLGEGYGLTAAESAACGTPVVASADPALVELLGDAGLYADAGTPSGFAEHLAALATDPSYRRARGRAASERATAWSWAAAADTTVAVLEEVAGRHG